MSDTKPKVWRRSDTVLWRSLAGASVLRSHESGDFVTLQSIANLVWLGLEYPATEEELVEDIDAVVGQAHGTDVAESLAQLLELGFVISV